MTGNAVAGSFQGERLQELPLGEKVQWGEWRRRRPDTRVLSVAGREHIENNPYDNYFASDSVFQDAAPSDTRLAAKEPIFSFRLDGRSYAVPLKTVEGGRALQVGVRHIFLYRPEDASVFDSTGAFQTRGRGFQKRDGVWRDGATGASFDPESRRFHPDGAVQPLQGFDTFWYMWSETHPETELLN